MTFSFFVYLDLISHSTRFYYGTWRKELVIPKRPHVRISHGHFCEKLGRPIHFNNKEAYFWEAHRGDGLIHYTTEV